MLPLILFALSGLWPLPSLRTSKVRRGKIHIKVTDSKGGHISGLKVSDFESKEIVGIELQLPRGRSGGVSRAALQFASAGTSEDEMFVTRLTIIRVCFGRPLN